ncbi:MAG: 5'-3' exonuclease H3TH domain-containing protein [Myxococcales bacterium]
MGWLGFGPESDYARQALIVTLLDGTYELFRAFYGAPAALAPDGREVGATRGLLRSFAGLLSEPDTTHVAAAFDTVIESFRNQLFDGYKTGAGIDPALWAQFPLAERATRALGIVTWSMIDFEADDALATGARRYAADERVQQVRIASPDKDLCQCVSGQRVVLLDRRKQAITDEPGVSVRLGVPPASVPGFLALVGDTADGIPGVPRWGEKSAAKVLSHYGLVENIPDQASAWAVTVRGADALARELASHRAEVVLYEKLATLRFDVPLEEDLDALRWRGPTPDLAVFCEELGMPDLTPRLSGINP